MRQLLCIKSANDLKSKCYIIYFWLHSCFIVFLNFWHVGFVSIPTCKCVFVYLFLYLCFGCFFVYMYCCVWCGCLCVGLVECIVSSRHQRRSQLPQHTRSTLGATGLFVSLLLAHCCCWNSGQCVCLFDILILFLFFFVFQKLIFKFVYTCHINTLYHFTSYHITYIFVFFHSGFASIQFMIWNCVCCVLCLCVACVGGSCLMFVVVGR